jgi:AcrR family transcriptional regulator
MAAQDGKADKAVSKIMAGTMAAVSRQGIRKLSVSDICEASRISRGTFYRYFTGKDDVLASIGQHFEDGIRAAFDSAIEAEPDPAKRVEVVLGAITAYRGAGLDFARMLDVAPEFTLEFIRETFPTLVDAVTDALGPAATQAPLVVNGVLTVGQLGDMFMRAVLSMLLLPGSRADEVPTMVGALFAAPAPRDGGESGAAARTVAAVRAS